MARSISTSIILLVGTLVTGTDMDTLLRQGKGPAKTRPDVAGRNLALVRNLRRASPRPTTTIALDRGRDRSRSRNRNQSRSQSKSQSRSQGRTASGTRKTMERRDTSIIGIQTPGRSLQKSKEEANCRKRKYRFDSPPKGNEGLLIAGANAPSMLQNIQAVALAQAAKVDRKLYVGNLPPGINPPTVLHLRNGSWSTYSIRRSSSSKPRST